MPTPMLRRRPALFPLLALLPLLFATGCVTKQAYRKLSHRSRPERRLDHLRRARVLRTNDALRVNAELIDSEGSTVKHASTTSLPTSRCRALALSLGRPMPAAGDVALIDSSAILYEVELDGRLTGRTFRCHEAPPVEAILLVGTGTARETVIRDELITLSGDGEDLKGSLGGPETVGLCPSEILETRRDGSLVIVAGRTSFARPDHDADHQCGLGCGLVLCGGLFGALIVDAFIAAGYVAITCPELVVLILANT